MKLRTQSVIAERGGTEWLVLFDDGSVRPFPPADEVFEAVTGAAKRKNPGATVTKIEWRNTPVGFKPPGEHS